MALGAKILGQFYRIFVGGEDDLGQGWYGIMDRIPKSNFNHEAQIREGRWNAFSTNIGNILALPVLKHNAKYKSSKSKQMI